MQFKKIVLSLVVLTLFSTIAEAKTRKKHRHYSKHSISKVVQTSNTQNCDNDGRCTFNNRFEPVSSSKPSASSNLFAGDLVSRARSRIGASASDLGLPSSLWCADFMNSLLDGGTHSRAASSYAHYGHRVPGPQIGAIAVMSRGRRGGHVGVVSGIDGAGNPIIISGNHGRRVGEGTYPKRRVYAYVMP